MTIDEAKLLKPGDRIRVRLDKQRLVQTATVIRRPSKHHAKLGLGFLWVEFNGSGIPEVRQQTIHAREILDRAKTPLEIMKITDDIAKTVLPGRKAH